MLEVYLVRHGKTVFNTIGRLQGWSDSPLTDEGRAAAAALGCRIGKREIAFDAAFSSTAPRAAETASLILQQAGQSGLSVRQLPDLREYCFGGFEGEFTHVLHQKLAEQNGFPDAAAFQTAFRRADRHLLAEAVAEADPLALAENEERFTTRIRRALEQIAQESADCHRVLAVSHGMTITAILKSIDSKAIEYRSIPNVSVSRLILSDGHPTSDTALAAALDNALGENPQYAYARRIGQLAPPQCVRTADLQQYAAALFRADQRLALRKTPLLLPPADA